LIRYHGSGFTLAKPNNVMVLLGAATVATAMSGIGGAVTFKFFHSATTPIWVTWQHWFASDALGIIVVAPLLIEFASAMRDRPPVAELLEGALTVAMLALVSALAIFLRSDLLANVGPVAVLFAPLLWLAARCRPVFACRCGLSLSVFQSFGQRPLA
jgi:integral membrane sensor domain MASE1